MVASRLTGSRVEQPTAYQYNGDGVRTLTNAGQSPFQTHVYDTNRPLATLLYDGSRKYVWGAGPAFAVDANSNLEVCRIDGSGSVRAVTCANGNVTQTYQTDAYGAPLLTQGTSGQPFQFAGFKPI